MSDIDIALAFQAVNRSSVASLAFLAWDICITIDDEVELIWPNRWTFMKVLYFFVRFVPLFVQISILFPGSEIARSFHFSQSDCSIWGIFQMVAIMVISLAVDWILMLRVNALYHGHRGIRLLLAFMLIFEITGMSVGLALTNPSTQYGEDCSVLSVPKIFIIYGASTLVVQVVLFVLTMKQFLMSVRSGDKPLILDALVRDGTRTFVLVVATELGHGILFLLKNRALFGVLFGWTLTVFSFSGYHILLNLQRVALETRRKSKLKYAGEEIQFAPATVGSVSSSGFDSENEHF